MNQNRLSQQNWTMFAPAIMAGFFAIEIINFIKKDIICAMYNICYINDFKGANNDVKSFNK
ncbi:hypothetical protein [Metamycoplasma neophronis]|uniref:Uncharacterized protein n=1 Tax=Metamycoplasma neophronis TaxID=872983 RepID=A0ABY2YZS9_9BACT|nr:hypothetical protein [Metamycoplasma neophronis]TPR53272.1 hypothetical protein FJR74_02915 [Metamycoplasma neophronis]